MNNVTLVGFQVGFNKGLEKQALLPVSTIGAALGAAKAKEGMGAQGAGYGLLKGLGTDIGSILGAIPGGIAGMAGGGLIGGPVGAVLGGGLGALGGGGLGGYGGYRLSGDLLDYLLGKEKVQGIFDEKSESPAETKKND